MKRYRLTYRTDLNGEMDAMSTEDPDGEWVSWDDAAADQTAGQIVVDQYKANEAELERCRALLRRCHYSSLMARDLASDIAMALAGTPAAARQPPEFVRRATPIEEALAEAARAWADSEYAAGATLTTYTVTTSAGPVVITMGVR